MADETKRTPAYVSYKTFKSSITGLEHVPDTIDYSVYQSMNGSTRNFLFGAFKFFGLIDGSSSPSKRFKEMATADDAAWKRNMSDLIRSHYTDQLAALSGGTIATLKNSFGDIGPSVVGPACRFLIAAAQDVGMTVSPSVARASVGNATPRTRRTKKTPRAGDGGGMGASGSSDGGDGGTDGDPLNTLTFPVPITGKSAGKIVVPKDLSEADLAMFNAMVAAVVAYAKQNEGSK